MDEQVENEVEETTQQDSPPVETNQTEAEEVETAEKPEKTPTEDVEEAPEKDEDRNWKAVRQRLDELEKENQELKSKSTPKESAVDTARDSEVVKPWLTADDNMTLQLDEFKATERYPELDVDSDNYDPLFEKAVAGEYRTALDRYTQSILTGKSQRLPSVSRIAKDMKKEWDSRFGQVSEKAKQEGAKAAKQARGAREATVEAEGRSDARRKVNTDQQELRYRSQRGDDTAIAERLTRSEL